MATQTYSAAPFISHDGVDENGVRAEVRVVTGYGDVDTWENSKKGASANVFFTVSNSEYQSKGWAPIDSNVMKKVEEAKKRGEPLHFRIEQKRKDGIDRSIPLSELLPKNDATKARENAFRSLVAVKFEDEDEWTVSPHALTRFDEDPQSGNARSALNMTKEELDALKPTPNRNVGGTGGGYTNSIEPPPYITRKNDGTVNEGSIAVSVPLTFYSYVAKSNRENKLNMSEKQIMAIAKILVRVANKLQISIHEGALEKPDFSLGSHVRARALVFGTIEDFYPFEANRVAAMPTIQEWAKEIHEKALEMWKWSIEEVDQLT